MLISYTMPCHKRSQDLYAALPSVVEAAKGQQVEILVVDYGNALSLPFPHEWNITSIGVRAEFFHMAHARNVGIKAARGEIVCAFVCDQIVAPDFVTVVRELMRPGVFLSWQETFVFWREDILAAGGFDERFELYGPEGKELAERMRRRGLREVRLPKDLVYQIPTAYRDKISHYRLKLTRREMHHLGMAVWRECQGALVANEGKDWGSLAGPELRTYSDEQIAEVRRIIERKKREAALLHA